MPDEAPNHHEQPDPQDTFTYDVFVAYSAVDASWVQSTLLPPFHAAQVRVMTSEVFELGAPKASEFEQAVLSSGKTLLVLTPAALKDEWAEFAAILVHTLDPASRKRRFIPVIKEPCDLPLHFQGLVTFDATGAADWERLIRSVRAPLPEPLPPAIPVLSIPSPAPLPAGSRMPLSHNPLFVGREDELRELARMLNAHNTAAIRQVEIAATTGLGGIGKTQLAAEFVHRYGQYFTGGLFWLSFADPAAVSAEVAACGGLEGMRLSPDFSNLPLEDQVRWVLAEWHKPIPRLLVFDTCEDETVLDQWRPKHGGCRVLVTSRRTEWDRALGVQSLPLSVLRRAESITLLRSFRPNLPEDDADLHAIAAELGDLPLALHLAGSFLELYQEDMTAREYLNELWAETSIAHESLAGAGISPTKHDLSVARTFHLSYDRLDASTPTDALALALLVRTAYFAPGELIPRDLLSATLELPPNDRQAKRRVTQGMRRLVSLGLLEDGADGAVRQHRLIAAFVRSVAPNRTAQTTVEHIMLKVADTWNDRRYPAPLLTIQSHLRAVTDAALERQDAPAAALGNALAYHLYTIGIYPLAQRYFEQVLVIRQRVLGTNHLDTVKSLNNLGNVLQAQGTYVEAQQSYTQALAISECLDDSDHLITATILDHLGSVLQAQGQYAPAQGYFEQALAVYEGVLGSDHPATATSLNNLGSVLQDQGRYTEAQGYYEQALQRVLGVSPLDTAGSLNNLGSLFKAQGQYPMAQRYFEQALAVYEDVLGSDHPFTAASLNNMGMVLQAQGHYPAAQRFLQQALDIYHRLLGPDHPYTAASLNNLGGVLQEQGRYKEAQDYFERALDIRQRVVGRNHSDTAQTLNNLGMVFQAQEQYVEAQHSYEQALAIRQRVLGADHPHTAIIFNNLGSLFQDQGRYSEAQGYFEQALVINQRVLGVNHPDTAQTFNNLGSVRRALGQHAEAQHAYEQAVAIRQHVLGADHPHTAASLNDLGALLGSNGQYAKARHYLNQALAVYDRTFGADHPSTRIVRQNLAALDEHSSES